MIATDKRKAIFLLHQEGMSAREIARRLGVDRDTVRQIIQQAGATPRTVRADKQRIDPELLRRLYTQCEGWIQRVHEKLVEEEGIQVKYSTLTKRLRELGISTPAPERCQRVPDEPGAEMQHDTSVYWLRLGEQRVKVIASLMYLRYSKRRYLKFYRWFNRFRMKCFFYEALTHWGYAARRCIIDNTNLARLRGAGQTAIIVPEMERFGQQFAFEFRCHEIDHPNRKAGEERSFWTVETNFFPGRTFQHFADLNQQAKDWSTGRLENRPQGKAGLIPAQAFEYEAAFLIRLPPHLPAPYQIHERGIDQYGYVAFDGNYYWVPGAGRPDVRVLQYSQGLKIYQARDCVAEYPLPDEGVKNQRFSPEGLPAPPHQPHNRRHASQEEETRLRALSPAVAAYLDFALPTPGLQRHQFVRRLFALSRKMTTELFSRTLARAAKYRITSLDVIQRIAVLYLGQGPGYLPFAEVHEDYQEREAYQEGSLTEKPDLSIYDDHPPPDHE
jgi:transposase